MLFSLIYSRIFLIGRKVKLIPGKGYQHNVVLIAALLAIRVSYVIKKNSDPGRTTAPAGGGVLPYMGFIGMCGPKGHGFSAVLVINRVSNLADSGHK